MSTSNPDDILPIEPIENTAQHLEDPHHNQSTDAERLRHLFGIPGYERERFADYKRDVFPGLIEHVWDGPPEGATREKGGTDCLTTGPPGTGKSTWHLYLAVRLMEENSEAVAWRGSTARSEWLPFAPVTRVCLPSSVDVDARLVPKDPTNPAVENVALDDVVREVCWYDDVRDLNQRLLEPGQFHVVYPDPLLRGIQDVYEAADEKAYQPPPDRPLFHPDDPSNHFWFGWLLDRVENGPYEWTSLILDEIGDLASQEARKDSFGTYQKIELMRDCYVDARKTGLSIFAAGHSETDIHAMIRRKMRWRIQMPGQANPTTGSDVVGFESVPMNTDLTSKMSPGELLAFNERHFDQLAFSEIPSPVEHSLQVSLEVSE
jgi:hypothetical protein